MDQYESPEPKFFTHASTGARNRLIVCCQPDRHKDEILPTLTLWSTVNTVAKLDKVIQEFCCMMVCNRLELINAILVMGSWTPKGLAEVGEKFLLCIIYFDINTIELPYLKDD